VQEIAAFNPVAERDSDAAAGVVAVGWAAARGIPMAFLASNVTLQRSWVNVHTVQQGKWMQLPCKNCAGVVNTRSQVLRRTVVSGTRRARRPRVDHQESRGDQLSDAGPR
jgi:hypothetical protein